MTTRIQLSKEQLAERYATLNLEKKKLETKLRETADELICMMTDGDSVRTPEYSVVKNEGRKTLVWTETGKPYKKQFEQELISKGLMTEKTGESYIQVRFNKESDAE